MKNRFISKVVYVFLIFTGVVANPQGFAAEQGHYYSGWANIRDVVQPPKGFYFTLYDFYIHSGKYMDKNGNRLKGVSADVTATRDLNLFGHNVPIVLTGALNADIDVQLDIFQQIPYFAWVTGLELWGWNHAMVLATPFGYTRIKANAGVTGTGTASIGNVSRTISGSRDINITDSKYGFGDLTVCPLWFSKHGKRYDAGFSYGFYAPTGAYDEGDLANVGMGFWTHQWQANNVYYLTENRASAFMTNLTYELNSKKYDKDVRPGQVVTLEYGFSQYLHERAEIGVTGSHQWQITEDTGSAAVNKNVKDRMNAIGGQVSFWPIKEKMMLTGRCSWEYGGKDRFQGITSTLNVTWIFGEPIGEKLKKQNAKWA